MYCAPLPGAVSREPVPRGAVLENFAAYQPRRVTFESVKPRQRLVPRGRSSNDEPLQNKETFGSYCLR